MGAPIFQVDSFTPAPFKGNPAAVCLLDEPADGAWMQAVASEMNLSETAFVSPRPLGDAAGESGRFNLRWFTPVAEVDLCGHATLAAAHVLFEAGRVGANAAALFATRSGELRVTRDAEWLEMDFPALPPTPADPPPTLAEALGAGVTPIGRNALSYEVVEVADAQTLRALEPDMRALAKVDAVGIVVTAPGEGAGCDFVCRFFGPRVGVDEDPVTGSAYCALAPVWGARLGKETLVARQLSARGGEVRLRAAGERVVIAGQAVTTLSGTLADAASPRALSA